MPIAISNSKHVLQEVLSNEDTFATTLLVLLIDRFGLETLEWHPETIHMELSDEFHIEIPVLNTDKLNAAIDIATSNSFYKQMHKFIQYCNVLSGSHFHFGVFDPADAMECAWGITEAMLIYPPEEDEPFSEEIRYYIGKVLHDEGIKTPPDVLRIGLWDAEYSDMSTTDPEMFQMEFEVQADEAKEITEILRSRLRRLLEEIEQLPLDNGDVHDLRKKLRSGLG